MSNSTWRPSKGREIEDLVSKINEIIRHVDLPSTTEGGVKKYQKIAIVKQADGTHKVRFKTEEGWIESDNTTFTLL